MKREKNSPDSQNGKIRAWLLEGHEITSWDAIRMFRCTRLSARIMDLRDEGLDIVSKRRITADGTSIAVYSLKKVNTDKKAS